ncbi:aromatic ring-hydroxylating dioxygenase subunit alpha [filamentous cyanobacterium LEGE 11480]|uniref:Aromatic ring-hydroxylating dioxygenase subunit alpha n=1 Tax=Romeriopsis navalis LEGE 11480 TaxID=2777977 RepID=A0A928Z0J9_9CYAN|nr:aromatic ring-hydroxylating dioxygenase subunit alpha [Romeriopsis navalis]MBE9028351.1 aromatic ring-hydroxylating dioxygenase subunit alpha [Romeriopsis navalis LEGE 11480]
MESTTATLNPQLTGQIVQNQIRTIGINPNYWYAVAWAKDVTADQQITPVKIWNQEIALYRDQTGQIQAVEDICPHKGVSLHKGSVKGDNIVCAYHGWEFSPAGECSNIPYYPTDQKLPRACLRTYPVRERYGLIFLFPGDQSRADSTPMLEIPQYDDPNYLMIPIGAEFESHYTICNENTMDVFHGHLHQNLQGWYDPILKQLQQTENSVCAEYQVSYSGIMTNFLGLNDSSGQTTQTITVDYVYPNYINTLKGSSFLYLMRLPIDPSHSRSFAMMFVKVRIPRWILDPIRTVLEPVIRERFFMRFLRQDIEMIESEYSHYKQDPERRYVEVNPAIIAVQRLMQRQHDRYISEQTKISSHHQPLQSQDRQAS